MNVGDRVLYVPDLCHAMHRKNGDGDFPWILGYKTVRMEPSHNERGELYHKPVEYVEELKSRKREEEILLTIARSPDKAEAVKNIVFLRPRELWPAIIQGINDDGTINIAVNGNRGGVTLHCHSVPIGKDVGNVHKPHTCYLQGEE